MRHASLAAAALAATLLAGATPARAQRFQTPTQRILLDAPSSEALRARLAAHADSVTARAPQDAGAAWHWCGVSLVRAGRPDGAAVAFRRAWALRASPDDAVGLAEAWSATGRGADAESALRFVAALPPAGPEDEPASLRLWRAYAAARLAGPQGDRAALDDVSALLSPARLPPAALTGWARRLAPFYLATHGDFGWAMAWTLAVASRGRDAAVRRVAAEASAGRTRGRSFDSWFVAAQSHADSVAALGPRALGMRPLLVRAAGDTLHAWWLPARDPAAPLVVALGTIAAPALAADSLAAQLHREGIAFALLEPRGTGGSSVRGCALPADWAGHEDSLTRVVASDIGATITACTRAGGHAPAHVAVGAERDLALAAALAARDDGRVGALLLAGLAPSPADQGTLVATLAASGVPAFFQTSVEDFEGNQLADRIVARLPARQSRVAESEARGRGYEAFRAGPAVGRRFTQWLPEAWSRPRATPPARPR